LDVTASFTALGAALHPINVHIFRDSRWVNAYLD